MSEPVREPSPPLDVAPASERAEWAVLLAMPAVCVVVGLLALPHPAPVAAARNAVDRDALQDAIVEPKKAKPKNKLDAVLGDRIHMVGADIPKKAFESGDSATLRFYFQALREMDRNWEIFVHVDKTRGRHRIHGDHFPVSGRYHTALWQTDEVVIDRFELGIPMDSPPGTYDVLVGFYIGDERLPFSGGDRKQHAGENRVRAGTITIR